MAELFESYEYNNPAPQKLEVRLLRLPLPFRLTPRGLRVLRLVVISLTLHALSFVAIIYVPILREMFNLADKFSDVEYVDEAYQKTQIQDRVVAMLDASNFQYPPGYFNMDQTVAPQPPVEQPTPLPTPIFTPRPTPLPTPTPEPTPAADEPQTKEAAEKALDDIAATSGVTRPEEGKINKRPLKDWLADKYEKYKTGKIDLSKTIELIIEARRDDKGRLHDPQVVSKSGDPSLLEAGKDLVSAINDSNLLYFLEGSGGGMVRFIVRLDSVQVTASVESEMESASRAEKMAVTYAAMLLLGKIARSDKDEGVIYQNTQISSRGNQVILNFSMSRQVAGEMLKKQLPAS
ncbi:MAG TPA: hypothetical protein VF791_14260 [Pyrinomonadaceae bacterium]